MNFDWSDLAFGSKKPVKELKATFIAAPRNLSNKRLKELLSIYLKEGNNVVLGLAKEAYVEGFEGQPHFKMLKRERAQTLAKLINLNIKGVSVCTLEYFQRELPYILEKIPFKKVILVRGSWRNVFHASSAYYLLAKKQIPWRMESPFSDEKEAKAYSQTPYNTIVRWVEQNVGKTFDTAGMLDSAEEVAKFSFDYSFQTGAVLGKREEGGKQYKLLLGSCNQVVPYKTYALHWGNSRETNLSPPNDLNHYDTVHAETDMIVTAGKLGIGLKDTTLFINLLPCPTCARVLARSDISEFVYSIDHSDGYAVKMLEAAGKKVRRVVR